MFCSFPLPSRADYVEVLMSRNPLPTISFRSYNSEWFDSIVQKLHWNVRSMQKPLQMAVGAGRAPSPAVADTNTASASSSISKL